MRFLLFSAFVLSFFVMIGCSPDHTYIYYEFDRTETIDSRTGTTCSLKLRGSFVDQPTNPDEKRLTIVGNPYEIFIRFRTDRSDVRFVTISSLKFALETGQILDYSVVLKKEPLHGLIDPFEKEAFKRNFLFEGIELPHERCRAEIEVIFELKSGEKIQTTYSIELIPSERTEESVDWWDNIMSV